MIMQEPITPTPIHSINIAYKRIVMFFIITIIAIVCLILYFALSKAEIYLTTKGQPAKINFTAQVKENLTDNNFLESNILNGRILEITMEKTKEFSVEGKEISAGLYGGVMTITNTRRTGDQQLIKTTRLLSKNGKIFRIQKNVTVPANGSIDVSVIADGDSEEYNLAPQKFTIPGLNESSQKLIYGETKEQMKKESRKEYMLSQKDLDNAKSELSNELKNDSFLKLKELLTNGEELREEDILIKYISSESNKKIDENTEKFNFTLKSKVIGLIFSKEDLLTLGQALINKQLGSDQQLNNFNNDSFKYTIGNYSAEEKSASIEAELTADVKQNTSSENFDPAKFKGLSQEEIIDYFRVMPGIKTVRVNFWPFWVTKAPKLSNHIKIIVE